MSRDLDSLIQAVAINNQHNFNAFYSEIKLVEESAGVNQDVIQTVNFLKMTYSIKFYAIVAKQVLLLMGKGSVHNTRPQLPAARARDLLIELWKKLEEYTKQLGNFDLLFLSGKIKADILFDFLKVEQALDQLKALVGLWLTQKKMCTDRGELVHKLICCAQLGHCFRQLHRHD